MKTITYWVADDGTQFQSEYDRERYERIDNLTRIANSFLIPQHKSWSCHSGPPYSDADEKWGTTIHGYIQQSKAKCFEFRKVLGQMSARHSGLDQFLEKYIEDGCEAFPKGEWVPFGYTPLIRLVEELPTDYWQHGWFRIACIDKQFREYEQPFFAEHPEEAAKQRSNQIG